MEKPSQVRKYPPILLQITKPVQQAQDTKIIENAANLSQKVICMTGMQVCGG